MEFDAVAIRSDFTPYDNWKDMVDEGVIDERDLADELGFNCSINGLLVVILSI